MQNDANGNAIVNPTEGGAGYRYEFIAALSSQTGGSLQASYWFAGAVHVYPGEISFSGYTFKGNPSYPLTFKLVKNVGFVYLCGRGTVISDSGETHHFGEEDTVETWLPRLNSEDPLDREGAAQALGWLAITDEEKNRVVPVLIEALKDKVMEVRRNAAEALGRIGDVRAIDPLLALTDEAIEKDEWVREVAAEALNKIK